MGEPVRLQKILASAGFGSRRGCEAFITEGRVSVDGSVITELGAKADVDSQSVELDGRKIAGPGKLAKSLRDTEGKVYYALNKPKGALCTNEDPAGRPIAINMIPEKRRIFCVGRLDLDTEGLILLTNDGALTNQLTHPRYGVPKTYIARVEGELTPGKMHKLQGGVHFSEGRTQGAKVRVRRKEGRFSLLEITISEGMNRQVRRMLARVDLKCRHLKRVAIGPIKLNEMQPGEYRQLSQDELERLQRAIGEAEAASQSPRAPSRSSEREEPRASAGKKRKPAEETVEVSQDDDEGEVEFQFDEEAEAREVAAYEVTGPEHTRVSTFAGKKAVEAEESEDDEELDISDDEELEDDDDTSVVLKSGADEELSEDAQDAEDEGEEAEETEEEEIANDAASTDAAVEALDAARPWEKSAKKGGKMWADRGDTMADPELTAAYAEEERALVRREKEKTFSESEEHRNIDNDRKKGPGREKPFVAGGRERKPWPKHEGAASSGSGERKPWVKREGGSSFGGGERKPWQKREGGSSSSGGGERKPWVKREGGSSFGGGERKPWQKREGGSSSSGGGERKPWVKREGGSSFGGGERKPWQKREGGSSSSGGGERKPWVKREGGSSFGGGERKPWQKREGGSSSSGGGERKPWVKREGGSSFGGGERKPWQKREGGSSSSGGGERKPWVKREGGSSFGGGERKPWVKREGGPSSSGGSERKPWVKREGGSSFGGGERKPWQKREGGSSSGGGERPKPSGYGDRRPWENKAGGESRGYKGGSGGADKGGARNSRPWEK